MDLSQLNWFTLVLISVITGSVSNIIQKASLNGEKVHPAAFSAFFQLIVGMLTVPLAVKDSSSLPSSINIWILVVLSSLLYFGGNLLYFYGLKEIEASQTRIIASTRSIWFLLLGFIFFKEVVTIYKILGILLIILGLVIVFYNKGILNSFNIKHIHLIIYGLVFSAAGSLDKYLLDSFTPSMYQVIAFILPALFTFLFIPGAFSNMKPLLKLNKHSTYLFLSSITYLISSISIYVAYKTGAEISKVGPVSQSSIILTVILGIIFLKERENLSKKLIGSFIVFAGVILMKMV